jgi:molecular chaperone DnaJ
VKVPAGIQPGETLIVREAGMPRLDRRGRGDLVCVIQVDVPKKLSWKTKKLLKDLGESLGEPVEDE